MSSGDGCAGTIPARRTRIDSIRTPWGVLFIFAPNELAIAGRLRLSTLVNASGGLSPDVQKKEGKQRGDS